MISEIERYILLGIAVFIVVVATPLLSVRTVKGAVTKRTSITVGVVLILVVAILIGIAYGIKLDTKSQTVPPECQYKLVDKKTSEVSEATTSYVPSGALAQNGQVLVFLNDSNYSPPAICVATTNGSTTNFEIKTKDNIILDPSLVAINDRTIWTIVASSSVDSKNVLYWQTYRYDGNEVFLEGEPQQSSLELTSLPVVFQCDPQRGDLLLGYDQESTKSEIAIYDSGTQQNLLQSITFPEPIYGKNKLFLNSLYKDSMVVSTAETSSSGLGSYIYFFHHDGNKWNQLEKRQFTNDQQLPVFNALVGENVLLQSTLSKNGQLGDINTFTRSSNNQKFSDLSTASFPKAADQNEEDESNLGASLCAIGDDAAVFQTFDATESKTHTYTSKWLGDRWQAPVTKTTATTQFNKEVNLAPPYVANQEGHFGCSLGLYYLPQPPTGSDLSLPVQHMRFECT